MKEENKKKYLVTKKIFEAPGVFTLHLVGENNYMPQYLSGQFISIYLPELGVPEGKAYSLSSKPGDGMSITIKDMGKFSHRLCEINQGDFVLASEPYGFFYSESDDTDFVLIAGGIGITPFRSIIHSTLEKNPKRNISLYFSNKTSEDIVFFSELDEISKKFSNFITTHFVTRQEDVPDNFKKGRVEIPEVLKRTKNISKTEFFLCGSISFVRDMWNSLKKEGVSEEQIYTEAFFSH